MIFGYVYVYISGEMCEKQTYGICAHFDDSLLISCLHNLIWIAGNEVRWTLHIHTRDAQLEMDYIFAKFMYGPSIVMFPLDYSLDAIF